MNTSLLVLAAAWIGYFMLHSLLASHTVKAQLINLFPGKGRWYRLVFNLLSFFLLLPLLWMQLTVPSDMLWKSVYSLVPGGLLFIAGGWIGREAYRSYDGAVFLGMKNSERDWDQSQPLVLSPWHRKVRHPLYFATILIVLGVFLILPNEASLVALGCILAYLVLGTRLEERKLIRQFGERYLSYRRQVPMFIPIPWNKSWENDVNLPDNHTIRSMTPTTSWPQGISYDEYVEQVKTLAREGKSSGENQSESYVHYTKMSASRIRRLTRTFQPAAYWDEFLASLEKRYAWNIFTESWCGDAAQSLPVLQAIAQRSEGKILLNLYYRDEHSELFDHYLTGKSRSIPKLVALDRETGKELGTWGPRPEALQERVLTYLQAPDKPYDKFSIEVQQWYNEDKGALIQEEIFRALQDWEKI